MEREPPGGVGRGRGGKSSPYFKSATVSYLARPWLQSSLEKIILRYRLDGIDVNIESCVAPLPPSSPPLPKPTPDAWS